MSLFVEDVVFSVHCPSAAMHEIVAPEDRLEELLHVGWKPNSKGILKHWSYPIQAMPHEFGEVHFDPLLDFILSLKNVAQGNFLCLGIWSRLYESAQKTGISVY